MNKMLKIIEQYPNIEVPRHLRNAPTEVMRELGNSAGYRYPHDYPDGFVPERYLPQEIHDLRVYEPTDRGLDLQIRERLEKYRRRIAEEEKK